MTNVLVYDMLDNHCMESEMNERIKEFKESARPEIDWAARYHVELNNGEKEKWMNEWFEKFAELIVRECMSIIKQGDGLGNEDDFDKGFQAGIAMAYNRIRAQMGVEE